MIATGEMMAGDERHECKERSAQEGLGQGSVAPGGTGIHPSGHYREGTPLRRPSARQAEQRNRMRHPTRGLMWGHEPMSKFERFDCVCLSCGMKVPHQQGFPCSRMMCPSCAARMMADDDGTGQVMKELGLRTCPDPILRRGARPIEHVGDEERSLFLSMLVNMWRWHGIGLAAPQVGVALRLVVAQVDGVKLALGNPVILEGKGSQEMVEGCLSLPDSQVNVARQTSVWVQALDIEDRMSEFKFEGLLGRVVQHEIDHLNGVLITDHGSVVQRKAPRRGKT